MVKVSLFTFSSAFDVASFANFANLAYDWSEFQFIYINVLVHWSSRVPKRYKQSAVIGDLHRSKRISSNFKMDIKVIKCKLRNADYPPKCLNSVMHQFSTPKNNDSFIIPPDLFEDSKPFILVAIPYCEENENGSKHFIKKFEAFTNQCYRIAIKWITRKVKSLFKVKSKNPHPSWVI